MVLPGLLSSAFGVQYANERMVMPMVVGGGLIVVANLVSLWPAPPTSSDPSVPDDGPLDLSDPRPDVAGQRPGIAEQRLDATTRHVNVG
jgi:hypothetical protein